MVLAHQLARSSAAASLGDRLELDQLAVDPAVLEVEDLRHAAGHAGREVAAGLAEHDDAAAGHVLAAVVADALGDQPWRRSCGRRTAPPPRRAGRSRRRVAP